MLAFLKMSSLHNQKKRKKKENDLRSVDRKLLSAQKRQTSFSRLGENTCIWLNGLTHLVTIVWTEEEAAHFYFY